MGKSNLQISHYVLARALNLPDNVSLGNATYDLRQDMVIFEVSGPDVPDCLRVDALITREPEKFTTKFIDVNKRDK